MAAVLVFPNRVGLYLSLILIGFYNAGRRVSAMVIAFEFYEPADRPTSIGLTNTLLGPFFALGAIVGGVLILFLGYQAVFALSLIVAAGGVIFLVKAVHEPRRVMNHVVS
jgi:MFS family permease